MRQPVQLQIVDLQHRLAGPCAAPKHRTNARREFGKGERLGHVVVRAPVQPANPIVELIRAGQQHHGHVGSLGPDAAQYIQAGRAVQIQIKQHHVKRLLRRQSLRFAACRCDLYRELLLPEPLL